MDEEHYFTIDFGVNFGHTKRYPDDVLDKLMEDSWKAGVDKVVSISNNIKECYRNLKLGDIHKDLHFTVGIHPHNAKEYKEGDLKFLEEHIKDPKCFGIGECGLDFNRNFSPQDKQLEVFEKQIILAKKHNAKLYMHCRDAHDEFIALLKKHEYYNGLLHCFTGNINQALEITSLGFKIGITGWLLDKQRNKDLVEVVKDDRITLDMLVVETDAPFMPVHRKRRESFPADTGVIVETIAELKKMDNVECGKKIYENSISFLNS